MTITIRPRTDWVNPEQPVNGFPPVPENVHTVVVHWPGVEWEGFDFNRDGVVDWKDTAQLMRSVQNFYLNNRGYSIGYNFVVGRTGDVFELRGLTYRNAANNGEESRTGVKNFNEYSVAILVVCDSNDTPTTTQVKAVRELIEHLDGVYGETLTVKVHGDVDSGTSCAGPAIKALLPKLADRPSDDLPPFDPANKQWGLWPLRWAVNPTSLPTLHPEHVNTFDEHVATKLVKGVLKNLFDTPGDTNPMTTIGKVDTVYGPRAQRRVKAFKEHMNLRIPDEVVGQGCWKRIFDLIELDRVLQEG